MIHLLQDDGEKWIDENLLNNLYNVSELKLPYELKINYTLNKNKPETIEVEKLKEYDVDDIYISEIKDIVQHLNKLKKESESNLVLEVGNEPEQIELKQNQIEKSKLEAKNILLSAKDEANDTIKELNSLYNNLKELENMDLENWSDSEIANFVKKHFQKGSLKNANKLRNKLNNSFDKLAFSEDIIEDKKVEWKKDNFKIGMQVRLNSFSEIATITSLSGKANQLQVQIGNAKMNIKLSDITKIVEENKKSNHSFTSNKSSSSFKSKNVTTEINVIGQNIEDACFIIDKYLDDCYLAKLNSVRIVHGKGTGKLREGIHNFLKRHSHVKSFRLGTFGEGEMGVTIVELK